MYEISTSTYSLSFHFNKKYELNYSTVEILTITTLLKLESLRK